MRTILSLALTSGLFFAASAASAAMIAPPAPHASTNIIQVRDGCGRGSHENRWGRCVPNRDRWVDGCDRYHHMNRWGRCVRNW